MINHLVLYKKGEIAAWYLRDSQYQLYKMLHKHKRVVANCHRRFGKGTTVFTYVFEQMRKRKIIVRYGAETQRQAYSIYNFLCEKIHYQAPELRPKWDNRLSCYMTENGSQLYIFGVKDSGEIDKARGVEAHIIIADEFGFWKFQADYIVKSVLTPQLLETNGQMIITSTPPPDMTHKFVDYNLEAGKDGTLFKWTIEDSVRIGEKTQEDLDKIIEDAGGIESEAFQREWMCELIASSERLVIPEAQDETLYEADHQRPHHFDAYVCMDLGLVDHTFVVFGYVDFKESILVIEEELMVNYTNTENLVRMCKDREQTIFNAPIYRRIGDCEMQQLFDMSTTFDYQVTPIIKRTSQSGKGFKESVLNGLRIAIKQQRIKVAPQCTNLLKQLKYGIWNEKRTDFERTDTMGHLDGIMALAYCYDNIDWTHNPFPSTLHAVKHNHAFISKEQQEISYNNNSSGFGRLIGR